LRLPEIKEEESHTRLLGLRLGEAGGTTRYQKETSSGVLCPVLGSPVQER